MGEAYRAEHRGRLFHLVWPAASYLFTNLTAAVGVLLFFVLNRTSVIGRERLPQGRNTLLLSNHQSMIDSWLVGISAYYPQSFWRPWLIPWNPAARENFFKNPILALFSDLWKAIPIREGRRDYKALYRMLRALREGVMLLFPEGTRTRDGSIGRGRPGAGLLALGTGAAVVPVTIDGMDRVLPIGSVVPRVGKRVFVYFGQPIDCSDFADRPRSKETAQELVDRVMKVLRAQQRTLRRIKAGAAEEPPPSST
jgi:1-acyl-sn-glycerol-3-phosphate acyltransferase